MDRFHESHRVRTVGRPPIFMSTATPVAETRTGRRRSAISPGWGYGKATLDGAPLYEDYQMHFMVTQGIRDRKTFEVRYPMPDKKSEAGEVNPATQQIDFYIRSPESDERNHPKPKSFDHFFAMEDDLEVGESLASVAERRLHYYGLSPVTTEPPS